jgi:hypothetical protein
MSTQTPYTSFQPRGGQNVKPRPEMSFGHDSGMMLDGKHEENVYCRKVPPEINFLRSCDNYASKPFEK